MGIQREYKETVHGSGRCRRVFVLRRCLFWLRLTLEEGGVASVSDSRWREAGRDRGPGDRVLLLILEECLTGRPQPQPRRRKEEDDDEQVLLKCELPSEQGQRQRTVRAVPFTPLISMDVIPTGGGPFLLLDGRDSCEAKQVKQAK
jgi:hypothetical protein